MIGELINERNKSNLDSKVEISAVAEKQFFTQMSVYTTL